MYLVRRLESDRTLPEGSPRAERAAIGGLELSLCVAALLLAQALPGKAEPLDRAQMLDLAKAAFFHVTVSGTLIDATDPTRTEPRNGKAFAVSRNLLITSQHVVGDPSEWKPKNDGYANEVARAIRPLDRNVVLRRADDAGASELLDPVVMTTPSFNSDAAGISLPNLALEKYFPLSMCEIDAAKKYSAIMTSSEPADLSSVDQLLFVDIDPAGYEPAKYGGLYVFDIDGNPNIQGEPEGHDGSPIFAEEDGTVVAIISAVTTEGSRHRILATPIQPLFPGASALLARAPGETGASGEGLKCSLSDTVKKIKDQVVAHATWSVGVDRESDGTLKDEIHLDYDSVADVPNIDEIKIQYEFFGKQRNNAQISRLTYTDTSGANIIPIKKPLPLRNRQFSTSAIVSEGETLVEPFVADPQAKGYIDYVEIKIFETHLIDGRTLDKETVLNFKWKQP